MVLLVDDIVGRCGAAIVTSSFDDSLSAFGRRKHAGLRLYRTLSICMFMILVLEGALPLPIDEGFVMIWPSIDEWAAALFVLTVFVDICAVGSRVKHGSPDRGIRRFAFFHC